MSEKKPTVLPFKIDIDDSTLDWINTRVKTARIPADVAHPQGQEWVEGTPTSVLEDLKSLWSTEYDWRRVEAKLNATYKMFTVELDEGDETINLHFVHHRSERTDAVPLLYPHGWPGNFTEVENLLPLTNPEDPKQQAFHIIAPTIPGFVFSTTPKGPGFTVGRIARVYHKLMLTLGYKHYVGQGGDWGSHILRSLALQYPDAVVGIHINFAVCLPPTLRKHPLAFIRLAFHRFTPFEKWLRDYQRNYFVVESAYSMIQATKPQTISHAVQDSPIGMLSWLFEKMTYATGPDHVWDKEMVITWAMLYLFSNSAGHARIYKAAAGKTSNPADANSVLADEVLKRRIPGKVAVGVTFFPYDVGLLTPSWGKATFAKNLSFFRTHEKGGHLPTVQSPDVLIKDFLDFFQTISPARKRLLEGQ